ncbi:MAG: hypothetical protein LBT56_07435 [Prevotellaceae bacterium]|jgi:hypothetical protein|nr:hypothetical protein [Prevotellaceae bacterium]
MKPHKLLIFALLAVAAVGCGQPKQNGNTLTTASYLSKPLTSERLEMNYTILLPENYEVETEDWFEDFIVFYIKDGEKTVGGIYVGNHPSAMADKFTSNLQDSIEYKLYDETKSVIMSKKTKWKIYFNGVSYFAETIMKNPHSAHWSKYIHLWTEQNDTETIQSFIALFSTFQPAEPAHRND